MNPIDFITDLVDPQLAFLSRTPFVAIIYAVTNGVARTHVILRGMGFVGDTLAYAVFPGIAVTFALGASVLIGGTFAGLVVTLLIILFSQNCRINEDFVIGIFFASAFASGLIIILRVSGYMGSLESVLLGSLTGVQDSDLVSIAFGSLTLLTVLALTHYKIVAVSLDRAYAQAMGMKVEALDLVPYLTVAATVVMSVQIVGNVLIIALLLTPATSAKLVTDRLFTMTLISPAIDIPSAFFGIWMPQAADLPVGVTIALILMLVFVLVAGVSALRGRMRLLKAARTWAPVACSADYAIGVDFGQSASILGTENSGREQGATGGSNTERRNHAERWRRHQQWSHVGSWNHHPPYTVRHQ